MNKTAFLSELNIIATFGAENASSSLSAFLKADVKISVDNIEFISIDSVSGKLHFGEELIIALVTRVAGEIEGNAVLTLKKSDAEMLVTVLHQSSSILEETANITISSFMNSITSHLSKSCIPNAPMYLMDMADSILSLILLENAETSDTVIVFSTRFYAQNKNLEAHFLFLPNNNSITKMQDLLQDDRN
jgi:chemotaxis protein CheC